MLKKKVRKKNVALTARWEEKAIELKLRTVSNSNKLVPMEIAPLNN